MVKAIKTTYDGINFRSRLEAKWAAFFQMLGWPFEYEPFDLDGYIPDFVLKFHKPLLVEVKPEIVFGKLGQYVEKIIRSGWEGEALIVGATLWDPWSGDIRPGRDCYIKLGLLVYSKEDRDDISNCSEAVICGACWRSSHDKLISDEGDWSCRLCGSYTGEAWGDSSAWDAIVRKYCACWKQAGNLVQWNK